MKLPAATAFVSNASKLVVPTPLAVKVLYNLEVCAAVPFLWASIFAASISSTAGPLADQLEVDTPPPI